MVPKFMSTFAESDTYIIHMDSSAMPKAFSNHHNWYLTTLSSISDAAETNTDSSYSSKLVYSYANAINGFSAVLSSSEFEAIKNSPGYISSIKDTTVEVDTTHTYQLLGLNSNYGAWPVSVYGKDVIIGVVDTGVWPESKSFNDDGMSEIPSRWKGKCESGTEFNSSMCNKKLIGARFFSRGLLAKNPNLTISMNSPRDTEGHGTHTSSTAAGSYVEGASYFGYALGTARGMAPEARVAMYKALWREGRYLSDILAAIDQAIADGVDVLSLSFGIDGPDLYADPVAIATFAAMEKGIFVSTSAGNGGPHHDTVHNGIPWVLTVAAGTIDREFQGSLIMGNGVSVKGLSLYPGNSSSAEFPMVFVDCDNWDSVKKVVDKIIVCLDTTGDPDMLLDQVNDNVRNSDAAGAVFITNQTGLESLAQTPFPSVFMKHEEGQNIRNYLKSETEPKARFQFQETVLGKKSAPKLAEYSSRGPSPSCPSVLKPDIMAPGDLVLASWSPISIVTLLKSGHDNTFVNVFSNFNLESGTSMACPHAAGVAALLKGAHPDWSPAAIRSAMMTTADVLDNTNNPIEDLALGSPATPFGMGAGHINPNKALDPGLVYDASREDYINLLCALNFTAEQIQTITRSTAFNCSNPSLDLNYPSFIAHFDAHSDSDSGNLTVEEFHRSLTNVGDANSVYIAKLAVDDQLKVSVSPDRLVFGKKYEEKSFKLRIEDPKLGIASTLFGSLTWIKSNGKHAVRSPIAVTTIIPEDY